MFRHHRVILRELETNTLPSYTSISNAAVGNTTYNYGYLMEAIPLCDIIEVYIYIYLFIYVYTRQYSRIVSNYNLYLVRGDMFRLLKQPYSGQLKIEQEP